MRKSSMTEHMYHVLRLAKLGVLYREESGNWMSEEDRNPHTDRVADPWPSAARACLHRGWIVRECPTGPVGFYKLTRSGRRAMKEYDVERG